MSTTAEAGHETQVRARFDAWSTSATFRRLKPWLAFIQHQVLDRIDVEYYRTEELRKLFARAGFEAIEVIALKPSYAEVRKLVRGAALVAGTAAAADVGGGRSAVASGRDCGPAAGVAPELLKILVCPLTKGPLRYDRERQELISGRAGLAYPVRDGIPIMLAEGARRLGDEGHPIP